MNNLKLLYWKIFKPAKYGAYLELCRLKARIELAKKNHRKVKDIQSQFYDTRARFELM